MIEIDFGDVFTEYIRKGFILLLGCFSLFFYIRYKNIKIINNTGFFLLLYLFYITLTLFWSENSEEGIIALIGLYICVFSAIIISQRYEYEDIVYFLMVVLLGIVICSWLMFFIDPDYTLNKEDFFRFKGVTPHSGKLAQCAILALFIIGEYNILKLNLFWKYFIYIVLLGTLFLTKMRSFITYYFLISLFIYFKRRKLFFLILPFIMLVYLFIEFGALDFLMNIYQRGSSDLTELTGRTQLWDALIELIKERPIVGYGFGAFKTESIQVNSWIPTHGHNLWLHQIYETGIIGNFLFNLVLFSSYITSARHQKLFGYSYLKYVIYFILIGSLTGLIVGGFSTPFYAIFIVLTFSESIRVNSILKLEHSHRLNYK